jgi:hypothetical protein
MDMAPLQKRALISLVLGLVWTAILVILFIARGGVETFSTDATTRILLSLLFVAMLLFTAFLGVPWKARRGRGIDVDERDVDILTRAPQVQLIAVMLTLAGWVIGLTEYYWEQGSIPITWPYLMMFSTLIASTLAQALGVLIGYRRS